MKTRFVIAPFLVAFLLGGCVVKSLHPFYSEEQVIFDEALLGSWIEKDSTRWEISRFSFDKGFMKDDSTDNSYLVELFDDSPEPQRFNAHLFRLAGKMYFDFIPVRSKRDFGFFDFHLIPAHSIALVEVSDQGNLTIGWFNEEWLGNLFRENRIKISHEVIKGDDENVENGYILTASTEELQKFIIQYGHPDEEGLCREDDNFLCVHLMKNL